MNFRDGEIFFDRKRNIFDTHDLAQILFDDDDRVDKLEHSAKFVIRFSLFIKKLQKVNSRTIWL